MEEKTGISHKNSRFFKNESAVFVFMKYLIDKSEMDPYNYQR